MARGIKRVGKKHGVKKTHIVPAHLMGKTMHKRTRRKRGGKK